MTTAPAHRRTGTPAHADRLFFLGVWLLYGILVNSYDMEAWTLQQLGVESLVERGQLALEGSRTPQFRDVGDVFTYDGHLLAAKQPGQFLAGALAYAVLHRLGLSYATHYLLVSALVTWSTAALATAATALVVLRLGRAWSGPAAGAWPWVAAGTFAFATTAAPFAGVPHHDPLAAACVAGAVCLAWRLHRRPHPGAAALAGWLLGTALTTSMLPAPMVSVALAYAFAAGWRRLSPLVLAGFLLGLVPLLAYNWRYFGHPLLVPNVAGNYADTFPLFDWANFRAKLGFYARMLSLYVPVGWIGLAGIAAFPAALRREQILLAAMIAALGGYVCTVETFAGCQYGPRYLLPAMPWLALGLVGFGHLRALAARRLALAVVLPLAAASAAINLTGALFGAMFCDLRRYGFTHYLTALRLGLGSAFPLALWLTIPLALWVVAVVGAAEEGRRR